MDVIPADMPSDDLQTAILDAQATLARAGDAVLPRDPLRFLLAGLSAVLGVFGRSTRRWERAVADVIAARDPLTDNDRAAIWTAMEDGAFRGMKQEARRVVRTLDRRLMALIGLCCGGAFVLGALSVVALLVLGVSASVPQTSPACSAATPGTPASGCVWLRRLLRRPRRPQPPGSTDRRSCHRRLGEGRSLPPCRLTPLFLSVAPVACSAANPYPRPNGPPPPPPRPFSPRC